MLQLFITGGPNESITTGQFRVAKSLGIHLVDLALWTAFPDQPIDYRKQIEVIDAKRWPTTVTIEQWLWVTGAQFPLQSGELL